MKFATPSTKIVVVNNVVLISCTKPRKTAFSRFFVCSGKGYLNLKRVSFRTLLGAGKSVNKCLHRLLRNWGPLTTRCVLEISKVVKDSPLSEASGSCRGSRLVSGIRFPHNRFYEFSFSIPSYILNFSRMIKAEIY